MSTSSHTCVPVPVFVMPASFPRSKVSFVNYVDGIPIDENQPIDFSKTVTMADIDGVPLEDVQNIDGQPLEEDVDENKEKGNILVLAFLFMFVP